MAIWQDTFHDWAQAWAAVQDLESVVEDAVLTIGTQHAMVWPGPGGSAQSAQMDSASELILVTEDPAGATQFAQSQGLHAGSHQILLCAQTDSLDLVPQLPPDGNLAAAPMENYDLVEVALFDRPVASGRLSLGEDVGVLALLVVDEQAQEFVHVFEQAMVAGLGEEAFTHGVDTLYLIANEEQGERFLSVDGWTKAAEILTFTK
ncbi:MULTISPECIES: hypothetical protein [Arthrobacter]|uniref:hypothetical protein n=1 Tax=unclassified Arthrobacter TaxID=235627 RepID=UPI0024B8B69D|nr:hypothetical protein [Arthrobacter sp. H35-MC1]MDJ0317938.1 hypothetical protein [Arthrobacter sp. H35-MC1]